MSEQNLEVSDYRQLLAGIWKLQALLQASNQEQELNEYLSDLEVLEHFLVLQNAELEKMRKETAELRDRLSGLNSFMGVH